MSQTKQKTPVCLFWLRRDLRLQDNAGLFYALKENSNVLPLFIFDREILEKLSTQDARVLFIYRTLKDLKQQMQTKKSDLIVRLGKPEQIFKELAEQFSIQSIYTNHDYEPAALARDEKIATWSRQQKIVFKSFKDQCVFEKSEIVSDAGTPYTVYTPYKKKWLASLTPFYVKSYPNDLYESSFLNVKQPELFPKLKDIGFEDFEFDFPDIKISSSLLRKYAESRDFPGLVNGTTKLGLHLRFGTLSVRELARAGQKFSDVWLSELIWRDFFMQILWHYPHVEKQSFRPQYEKIEWRKNKSDFQKWCDGQTGYPLVDAGMRELNHTGHMHNRVRMVVASFLTKHLLHHWYQGERYFAEKLLDYDLSANNGNWQWAAGTGCDAAPYFRVFNPAMQAEKFDPESKYILKWVPEFGTEKYVKPMVDHAFARNRALVEFGKALKKDQPQVKTKLKDKSRVSL